MLLGPKRFTDLRSGLPGASQNVLAQRLRELEESGVVRRRRLPPPAASRVYELTDRGLELEPVVLALARWGSRAPLRSDAPLSVDALVLALKSTFDAEAARGFDARVELRLGVQPHSVPPAEIGNFYCANFLVHLWWCHGRREEPPHHRSR
ncbi:helix-turn-helix domain-containing protein [Nonomuraea sp. NPDC000554]|uniref:winged helix-turn-helix transcriptional regulator n=1 Tax=Nonomuraea sp. NPDC000554 TaxID=3154259 RepID=UPI00332D409D